MNCRRPDMQICSNISAYSFLGRSTFAPKKIHRKSPHGSGRERARKTLSNMLRILSITKAYSSGKRILPELEKRNFFHSLPQLSYVFLYQLNWKTKQNNSNSNKYKQTNKQNTESAGQDIKEMN